MSASLIVTRGEMGKSAASLIVSISRFSSPRIVTAQNKINHTSKAKWFSAVFLTTTLRQCLHASLQRSHARAL